MIGPLFSPLRRIGFLVAMGFIAAVPVVSVPVDSVGGEPDRVVETLLRPADRIAILGGGFVERLQEHGALEAELHCRRPDWKLSVRNVGWSGDNVHGLARKAFEGPAAGFARLIRDLEAAEPSVVLVAYGFTEASDGPETVASFRPGLERLVRDLSDRDQRVVLMTPVAMPGVRVPGYGAAIEICREVVESVGSELNVPVISVNWSPSETELTDDRLLPNAFGYAALARELADRLVGGEPCQRHSPQLLNRIREKNELFFHHYRPQNETYLFLFRKHEQGQNASEIEQFKPLIAAADRAVWETARGR